MADIFISSLDGKRVFKFPFIPQNLPEVEKTASNETFETFNNGTFNLLNKPEPIKLPIEGKLPLKKYGFSKSAVDPYAIMGLLETAQAKPEPVRVIIYRNNGLKYINMLASVEKVAYSEGVFLNYSIELKEYRNYGNLSIASKLNKRT